MLKALHEFQCVEIEQDTILTQPGSPRKAGRSLRNERYRIQDRPSSSPREKFPPEIAVSVKEECWQH